MNFELLWDPKAISQLRKLPKEVSARIVKKVKFVGETGIGIEVLKDHEYGFKVRIGDYRVLCDLNYNPGVNTGVKFPTFTGLNFPTRL